jgi:isocitrate dehydrogenase
MEPDIFDVCNLVSCIHLYDIYTQNLKTLNSVLSLTRDTRFNGLISMIIVGDSPISKQLASYEHVRKLVRHAIGAAPANVSVTVCETFDKYTNTKLAQEVRRVYKYMKMPRKAWWLSHTHAQQINAHETLISIDHSVIDLLFYCTLSSYRLMSYTLVP